jgi:hypothetical protein
MSFPFFIFTRQEPFVFFDSDKLSASNIRSPNTKRIAAPEALDKITSHVSKVNSVIDGGVLTTFPSGLVFVEALAVIFVIELLVVQPNAKTQIINTHEYFIKTSLFLCKFSV